MSDVNELMANLRKMFAKAAEPTFDCPSCRQSFALKMRQNLEPYKITFLMEPMPGRIIDAKTVGDQVKDMAEIFEAIGREFNHETQSVLLGVEVDDAMTTKIQMAFIPREMGRLKKPTPAVDRDPQAGGQGMKEPTDGWSGKPRARTFEAEPCDHCGETLVVIDCPRCGAPNCCPTCCAPAAEEGEG